MRCAARRRSWSPASRACSGPRSRRWSPRRRSSARWLRFVERVAGGDAKLAEIAGLLWHCLVDQDAISREKLGEALVEMGLAAATPILKAIVTQILKGR